MGDDVFNDMVTATIDLRAHMNGLRFGPPTAFVYNPLEYAWSAHEQYLRLAAGDKKKVVFLGMNPGPFGMVQTSVPFGEVTAAGEEEEEEEEDEAAAFAGTMRPPAA